MEKSIYDIIRASGHAKPSATARKEGKEQNSPTIQGQDIEKYERELKERLHAIVTLRDLVVQQKKTIRALRKKQIDSKKMMLYLKKNKSQGSLDDIQEELSEMSDESPSDDDASEGSEPDELLKKQTVSFGEPLETIDEDVISAITCESGESIIFNDDVPGMGDDCREAIVSIQEQASQIDTMIALDKLDTATRDLLAITKDLEHRTSEVDELKQQAEEREARLASVELERDLLRAEVTRTKDDLQACVRYMANLHVASCKGESTGVENVATNESASFQRQQSLSIVPKSQSPKDCPQPTALTVPLERNDEHEGFEIAHGWDSAPTAGTEDTSNASAEDLLEDHISQSPLLPQSYARSASSAPSPQEPRNLGLCFWRQRSRESVDNGPAFVRMDDDSFKTATPRKRFKQSRKKHGAASSASKGRRQDNSPLKSKVEELNRTIDEAGRNAAELRRHLSSVTRYYDNAVYSLQQTVGILQTDEAASPSNQYTSDMIGQLSLLDHEKRVALDKLRKTNAMIVQLRREKEEILRSQASAPLERVKANKATR